MEEIEIIFDGGPLNGQIGSVFEDQVGQYFEFYNTCINRIKTESGYEKEMEPQTWFETYFIDDELRAVYLGRELAEKEVE